MRFLSHAFPITALFAICSFLPACGGPTQEEERKPALLASTQAILPGDFGSPRTAYAISRSSQGFVIANKSVYTDISEVSVLSTVRFPDYTVSLSMSSYSQRLPADDLKALIELYIAFFNRVPDAPGLQYWIEYRAGGASLKQIATSFYDIGVANAATTGYSTKMSDAEFVRVVYANALARTGTTAPTNSEVEFWAEQIRNGSLTRADVVLEMIKIVHSLAGHPTWGWVAKLMENRVAIGHYFAVQQGLAFRNSSESIVKSRAINAAVTADSILEAANLIGLDDPAFNLAVQGDSASSYVTVPRAARTVALVVDGTVLDSLPNDIDTFAKAVAKDRGVTTTILRAPGSAPALREALRRIPNLWGAFLIGDVKGQASPTSKWQYDQPFSYLNCPVYQIAEDGSLSNWDGMTSLMTASCEYGAAVWISRIRGMTPATQVDDIQAYLRKNVRLRNANSNWNAQYNYVQSGWYGGAVPPRTTELWTNVPLYTTSQVKYLLSGTSNQRESAWLSCIQSRTEICVLDSGVTTYSDMLMEGDGIVGQFYSYDSHQVSVLTTGLNANAKVLLLHGAPVGQLSAYAGAAGNFASNLLIGGDSLLVTAPNSVGGSAGSQEYVRVMRDYPPLALGASFADIRLPTTGSYVNFGDPTITLRPKPVGGKQPVLVIDGIRHGGPRLKLTRRLPDNVAGRTTSITITLRNAGTADLVLQNDLGNSSGIEGFNCSCNSWSGYGLRMSSFPFSTYVFGQTMPTAVIKPGAKLDLNFSLDPMSSSGTATPMVLTGNYWLRTRLVTNDPELSMVQLDLNGVVRLQ